MNNINPFSDKGELGRFSYFLTVLIMNALCVLFHLVMAITAAFFIEYPSNGRTLLWIMGIGLFSYLIYNASAKRINQIGRSTEWAMLIFIPIIGQFFEIYLCFAKAKENSEITLLQNNNKFSLETIDENAIREQEDIEQSKNNLQSCEVIPKRENENIPMENNLSFANEEERKLVQKTEGLKEVNSDNESFFKKCNLNPFSWDGYIGRLLFTLTWVIVISLATLSVCFLSLSYDRYSSSALILEVSFWLIVLVAIYILSCTTIKRIHSYDFSEKLFPIIFIPVVGLIFLLYISIVETQKDRDKKRKHAPISTVGNKVVKNIKNRIIPNETMMQRFCFVFVLMNLFLMTVSLLITDDRYWDFKDILSFNVDDNPHCSIFFYLMFFALPGIWGFFDRIFNWILRGKDK